MADSIGSNPFDQFDAPAPAATAAPKPAGNPFDQFDKAPSPSSSPAAMAKALSEGKGDMPSFGDVKSQVETTAKPIGPTSVTASTQAGGGTTEQEPVTPKEGVEGKPIKPVNLGHGFSIDSEGTMHNANLPGWLDAGLSEETRFAGPITTAAEDTKATVKAAATSLKNPEVRSAMPGTIMPAVWTGLDNFVGGLASGIDHLQAHNPGSSITRFVNEQEAKSSIPFLQKMGQAGLALSEHLDNPLKMVVDKSEDDKKEIIGKLDPKVQALVAAPLGEHTNAAALLFNMTSVGTNFAASILTGKAESQVMSKIADVSLAKIAAQGDARAAIARDYLARIQASRTSTLAGYNQSLSISGLSATEVESKIKEMTPEQFAATSPENAAAMADKSPDEQKSYIDLRAEIAGDRTFMSTAMFSMLAMKVPTKTLAGEAASNALYGVGSQVGENIGERSIEKDQPLTKGVLTAAIVSGIAGTLVGRAGRLFGAGEKEGSLKEDDVIAAAKRKALAAKVLAARPDATPEQRDALLKSASIIDSHAQNNKAVHAASAAGLTEEDLPIQQGKVDKTDPVREAVRENIRRYVDGSKDEKEQDKRIEDVQKLNQWATANGGRTPTESLVAFSHLIHTGELPPEIKEWSNEQVEGSATAEGGESGQGAGEGHEAAEVRPAAHEGSEPAAGEERPASQVATPRSQPVIDKLSEEGVTADVKGNGRVVVAPNGTDSEQAIKIAANDAAESAENERREPTPAQKAQGNYPKGRIMFASPKGNIPVDIENPAGSIRKSLPGVKPAWSRKMTEHYGSIPGTYSADGDAVDVIVGRKAHDDNLPIFVMQQTAKDGSFDEHKVVMGARSEREARDMYLKQYPASMHDELLQGQTKMVRFNRPQFVDWMKSGEHDVPINPMSKRPLLSLRQANGRLDSYFKNDKDYDKLDGIAGKLNDKFGTSIAVAPEGAGYRLSGDVPKAKIPSVYRSLQRQEGHERTEYNGQPAGGVYPRSGEEGGRPVRAQPAVGKADRGVSGEPVAGKPDGDLSPRPGRSGVREGVSGNQEAPRPPRWLKKVKTSAPAYAKGSGKNPVSVVGVNYSKVSGLNALDSKFAGTGSPGGEVRRFGLGQPKTADKHRMYFYVRQSNDLPTKEPVVEGSHAYEARLDNLYDVHADPDGIMDRLERKGTRHADAVEEAVKRAGYDGVVMKGVASDTPVVQLIGPHTVPVKEMKAGRYSIPKEVEKPAGTIEERMVQKIGIGQNGMTDRAAYERAVEDYKHLKETKGGHIVSADSARELSDDYLKDRSKSAEVHEPASAFVKQYFKDALKSEPKDGEYVLFTAGGTGAGKTSALAGRESELESKAGLVYDTNMNTFKSSDAKVQQVLDSGRSVKIAMVYREPVDALVNGALKRAERQVSDFGSGRTVPLQAHYDTHIGSLDTTLRLAEKYKDDPRVEIMGIDNSRGPGNAVEVPLSELAAKSVDHADLMQRLSEALEKEHVEGRISQATYQGFREGTPYEARPQDGRTVAGEHPEPERQEEPVHEVARTPAEQMAHVADIQQHVDTIRASWKGAPDIHVVPTAKDLPPAIASHLETAIGPDSAAEAVYYGGKVYLIGDSIKDKAHAEYVTAHETLGHYGMRATFGDELDNLLNEVHDSIKDTPEFRELEGRYGSVYGSMDARERANALTEEFLSDRAAMQQNPGVLSRVTAWMRGWGRRLGLVSKWNDNDILNLMDGVARNVREGKASKLGLPSETATHDADLTTTQSYRGAAGEGQITFHPDGSRTLQIGGMKADLSRVLTESGLGLQVERVTYDHPTELLAVTRLAGEEGKGYLVWPAPMEGALRGVGVPTERLGGAVLTPTSKLPPGEARFSVQSQPSDPQLRDRINRVMGLPESSMTPWDRFQHKLREFLGKEELTRFKDSAMYGMVDRFNYIAKMERKLTGGTLLDAMHSAWKMAWMSQNTREATGAVMQLGVPEYRDGAFQSVAGRKGLYEIFSPLSQMEDPSALRQWEFYAIARRSDQLQHMTNPDGTSKEKLLTPDDIKTGLALGDKYPAFKQVFDDWQGFNRQLLDLAVERGNMTKDMADLWKQNDYVPFYRVTEDDPSAQPSKMIGGLAVKSKRLTGSNQQIEPVMENIVNNTQAIIRRVYRNEALRRTASIGQLTGDIERMPMAFKPVNMSVGEIESNLEKMGMFVGQQGTAARGAKLSLTPAQSEMWTRFFRAQAPVGNDVFSVMENGKPVYFKVNDPDAARSLKDIMGMPALNNFYRAVFGTSKNFLTHAITLNPAFMLRHLERQMTHTWIQSGENFNPLSKAITGAHDAYTNSEFMQRMQMAGSGGNEYYPIDEVREALRGMGTHTTLLDSGHKIWMAYKKLGYVADQMNRMAIARQVLDRGGSVAEAAWQAQDLLNFKMQGGNTAARYLVGAVPFLNARIQGLYRIERGALGIDQSYKARSKAVASFMMKSAAFMAASTLLALHNEGDPRYEKLPDEVKNNYWNIFVGNEHLAIAKPFEMGALLSTLPESIMRFAQGYDGSGTFKKNIQRVLETVFRIDPMPALLNPIAQDVENKDQLTQFPIVPESQQKLEPGLQENPYTSPSIEGVAHAMPEFMPDTFRSPLRLQHLINGYVGSLGTYAILAADSVMRATGHAPSSPAGRLPGGSIVNAAFGGMVGPADTDPRNRYIDMIYEDKAKLDKITETMNTFRKQGAMDELNTYYLKHQSAAQYKAQIMSAYKTMQEYNNEQRAIYANPMMTPGEKRAKLDELVKDRNRVLENLAPMLNLVDSGL